MKIRRLVLAGLGVGLVLVLSAQGFAEVQSAQNRIPQQVIINGQRVNGVYVTAATGGMQTFSCPDPQHYTTSDGSVQGWACYEQATGVWLLNALAPAQQPIQQAPAPVPQPTVIYQQPYPATVIYTTPAPVVVAPAYPAGVVLGTAAINATGRIVSAAILGSRYPRVYYVRPGYRRW